LPCITATSAGKSPTPWPLNQFNENRPTPPLTSFDGLKNVTHPTSIDRSPVSDGSPHVSGGGHSRSTVLHPTVHCVRVKSRPGTAPVNSNDVIN
jgi:hypothetical protein